MTRRVPVDHGPLPDRFNDLIEMGALEIPFSPEWFIEALTGLARVFIGHDHGTVSFGQIDRQIIKGWREAGPDDGEPGSEIDIGRTDWKDHLHKEPDRFADVELKKVKVFLRIEP